MKTLLALTLLLFPLVQTPQERIKNFRNYKRFSVKYDKFRDHTQIQVGPFIVGGDKKYVFSGSQLYMTAAFLFPGQSVKQPERFSLWFRATNSDWAFVKDRDLNALVDGDRINLGEGTYESEPRYRGGLSESLGFTIPIDIFNKIGKAKAVRLRVGRSELELKDEHKEAFRDLYSLTNR